MSGSRLGRTALALGVLLEVALLLRLIPAGAFLALGLGLLTVVALLLWHPLVTVALVSLVALVLITRRSRSSR